MLLDEEHSQRAGDVEGRQEEDEEEDEIGHNLLHTDEVGEVGVLLFAVKGGEAVAVEHLHLLLEVGGLDARSEVNAESRYFALLIVEYVLQVSQGEVDRSICLLARGLILPDDPCLKALEGRGGG